MERIETSYREVLQRVRAHDPEFNPDKPVVPIDTETALALLPRDVPTAAVQYSVTPRRGLALVITVGGIEHIPLPDLDLRTASELVVRWYKGYYETWRIDGGLDGRACSAFMEPILDDLGRHAIWPVVERLAEQGIGRLILVPNRSLHVFPLHACRLENGKYLADVVEVIYAPVCRFCIAAPSGPVRVPTGF